jgi:hypothetical protein
MVPFVCQDCGTDTAVPGVLSPVNPGAQNLANFQKTLANHDVLVIPNTAINQFIAGSWGANQIAGSTGADGERIVGEVDQAKLDAIMAWVNNGGRLVLTDAALKFFDLVGLTENAVTMETEYMGGIRMDLEHPMLNKIRGGVKQTYEPTPLGFGTSREATLWGVAPAAFNVIQGSSVAGFVCGGPNLGQDCDARNIGLGKVEIGAGEIQFFGAILPDPSEEFYHPYGLDHYATTYSGNQIVRNMLGWDEKFAEPPVVITGDGKVVQAENEPTTTPAGGDAGSDTGKDSPGLGILVMLGAIAAVLFVRRK